MSTVFRLFAFSSCLLFISSQQAVAQTSLFKIVDALLEDQKTEPKESTPEKTESPEVDLTPSHETVVSVIVEGKNGNTLQSVAISPNGVVAGLIARPKYSAIPLKENEIPPTEVCIFDDQGSITKRWNLAITGQAITFSHDEKIYVAGNGMIAVYETDGKLVRETALPHLKKIIGDQETLRKSAIEIWNEDQERNKEIQKLHAASIEQAKENIAKIEQKLADHQATLNAEAKQSEESKQSKQIETVPPANKDHANAEEKLPPKRSVVKKNQQERWEAELKLSKKTLAEVEKRYSQYKVKENYTEADIEAYMRDIPGKLGGVKSIAATKDNIFVITNTAKGYGYVAWKITADMSESVVYKDKLSGCCSQVDLFANDKGIYMAENTKYRVGYYDLEGKLVTSFGKRARGKDEGFGGCCNPMNAFALADGTVFCSESAGEIKRFNADGSFAAFVGKVKLPNDGCKNVSFAVSKDGSKIYFADNVGSTLVILQTTTKKVTQLK